ncbi:heparinase II/III domain-containing protein [Cobetia amphilecti]|uniref:heparinase II/III domain-containing protein n=1 Tax=Cobetia amphilecti TaxID=1055104 RepID=UPI0034C600B9
MNINEEVTGLSRERIDEIFSPTWFGRSLVAGSGAKLWKEGSVCILNQPPYPLSVPVNWLDDPYDHRSWRWILNAFQWMDQLLAKFKLNYDEESIQICVKYFLDWAQFYITGEREGEFLWKDDAVSFRTLRLSIIADYIFCSGHYNEEDRALTEEILRKHYLELSNPKKFKSNNHGIFQMRALMSLLTLHPNVGDILESKKYVVKRLNWLWLRQYGTQNIHLENSTGYHQYIVKEFDEILQSPELKGLKFVFDKEKIEEVKVNSKYLFHPNGTGTLFGDSNIIQQKHEVVTGDHIFNEAGYAVLAGNDLTNNNSYLVIRTGFASNAHRHSDDFSFEWSEKNQIILQDSGRFAYDYNSSERKFVTSTMAHNTVSVDKGNYPWWGNFSKDDFYSGAITKYQSIEDGKSLLSLSHNFVNLDVKFDRIFTYKKGECLFVEDYLSSSSEHEYIQWFHFSEEFDLIDQGEKKAIFSNKKIIVEVEHKGKGEIILIKGQKTPFYQGWISYREKQLLPRWCIGFKATSKSIVLGTKFKISET